MHLPAHQVVASDRAPQWNGRRSFFVRDRGEARRGNAYLQSQRIGDEIPKAPSASLDRCAPPFDIPQFPNASAPALPSVYFFSVYFFPISYHARLRNGTRRARRVRDSPHDSVKIVDRPFAEVSCEVLSYGASVTTSSY